MFTKSKYSNARKIHKQRRNANRRRERRLGSFDISLDASSQSYGSMLNEITIPELDKQISELQEKTKSKRSQNMIDQILSEDDQIESLMSPHKKPFNQDATEDGTQNCGCNNFFILEVNVLMEEVKKLRELVRRPEDEV